MKREFLLLYSTENFFTLILPRKNKQLKVVYDFKKKEWEMEDEYELNERMMQEFENMKGEYEHHFKNLEQFMNRKSHDYQKVRKDSEEMVCLTSYDKSVCFELNNKKIKSISIEGWTFEGNALESYSERIKEIEEWILKKSKFRLQFIF